MGFRFVLPFIFLNFFGVLLSYHRSPKGTCQFVCMSLNNFTNAAIVLLLVNWVILLSFISEFL